MSGNSPLAGWVASAGLMVALASIASCMKAVESPTGNGRARDGVAAAQVIFVPPGTATGAGSHEQARGSLRVIVNWPRRIAAIPYSTDRIDLSVRDGAVTTASASLAPSSDGGQTTLDITVPAGEALEILARAYAGSTLVAQASDSVAIRANQRSDAALHLRPVTAPVIVSFPPNGGAGAALPIRGTGFGASRGVPVSVRIGGLLAPTVFAQDDSLLFAVVPAEATAGAIVVEADGIPSEPVGVFTRLTTLSPISSQALSMGVGATVSLSVAASTSAGSEPNPYVTWDLYPVGGTRVGMASGSFSPATGSTTVFTAIASGTAKIWVGSGRLEASASLLVSP